MVRVFALILIIVVGVVAAYMGFSAFRRPASSHKASPVPHIPSALAAPSVAPVDVQQVKIDHHLGDGQLAADGDLYAPGRVVKGGVVVQTHDGNVKIARPDGGVTLVGTDYQVPSAEVVEAFGCASENGAVTEVFLRDGRVYRLGEFCAEGKVESIKGARIVVLRPDGGKHLLTYTLQFKPPSPGSAPVVAVNPVVPPSK